MKHPPKLVCALCQAADAWIVGSAADPAVQEPRDWDVVVPFSKWHIASMLIPLDAKVNTFGGWKCLDGGVEVDVWPDDLTSLFTSPLVKHAWHRRSNSRITRNNV